MHGRQALPDLGMPHCEQFELESQQAPATVHRLGQEEVAHRLQLVFRITKLVHLALERADARSDLAFQQDYRSQFGALPPAFSDLNFDAAALLLGDLQRVSKIVNGNLVINRAALASAVRATTNFQGVSCTITLDPATGNRISDPASLSRCSQG